LFRVKVDTGVNIMFRKTLLIPAVVAAAGFMFMSSASAAHLAFTSCAGDGYDISGKVTPNVGCTILLPLDGAENDDLALVNTDPGFFGITDWLFDGKFDNIGQGNEEELSSYFDFTGGVQSGTFTYLGGLGDGDVMFVFKDGGDVNLVAYMIDLAAMSAGVPGVYSSPFVEPPFTFPGTGSRDISHISVYYRMGFDFDVPEPGTLGLLGLGLLGFALVRRRS
jgi:hypothetical protein